MPNLASKADPDRRVRDLFRHRASRVAAALVSGGLFYFSFNLTPIWFCAWLAPIPLLLAAFNASRRETSVLATLAILIGLASNFTYYLTTTGPVGTPVLMLLQACLWSFLVQRARSAVLGGDSTAVFVFPALTAGLSAAVSALSPHGTWGGLAQTQLDALPVVQIASVLGAPAIVFTMALTASTVAVVLFNGLRVDQPWLAYGLPAVLVSAECVFGAVRLARADPAPEVLVGLVSVDDFIGKKTPPAAAEAVWIAYAQTVTNLARAGARVIVFPEKIAALQGPAITDRQRWCAALAQAVNVPLIVGVEVDLEDRKENVSWWFASDGGLAAQYQKHHLVPHLEGDLEPGNEWRTEKVGDSYFGMGICRDLLFTGFGRHYGRMGVGALLVPAWDFYRDAWLASSVAAMRGIESGFSVVRAGRESYLNVSDRYGRVVARRRSDFLPGTSILAKMPLGPGTPTIYGRTGDVFGWLCLAGGFWLVWWNNRRAQAGAVDV